MDCEAQFNKEGLKRNVSYAETKKRRIIRSNSRMGNLEPVRNSAQDFHLACTQNVGSQIRKSNKKLESLNKEMKQSCKEKQNNNKIHLNQMHALIDLVQTSVSLKSTVISTQKIIQNAERLPNNLNLKKNKSLRILTKKIAPLGSNKIAENLMLRKNQNQASEYRSLPIQMRQRQTQNRFRERQNNLVMISSLSPIQSHKQKSQRASEVSGFSILEDIDQPIRSNIETKCLPFGDIEHLHMYAQLKMPKVMKRHLPKDFFLRV